LTLIGFENGGFTSYFLLSGAQGEVPNHVLARDLMLYQEEKPWQ